MRFSSVQEGVTVVQEQLLFALDGRFYTITGTSAANDETELREIIDHVRETIQCV